MKNFFKKHFTRKRIIAFFVVRKIIALILIFSFLTPPANVQAQAVPVANYVINRAIAGAVTKNVLRRGFAANDPRYGKTLQAISGNVTALNFASSSAGVALTIAGAPVWLTIAASLGVFALGAYIFSDKSKISVNDSGIKFDPAAPVTVPYVANYPPISSSRFLFLESYIRNGQKIYQGTTCFSTQSCFALPKMPANYEPLIKIELPSQMIEYSAFATGDSIVTFDSMEELTSGLLIYAMPPETVRPYQIPLNTAGNVVSYSMFDQQILVTDFFNWIIPPYIDVAQNGVARVVARYSTTRLCAGVTRWCMEVGWYFNPGQDYVSDDPLLKYPNGYGTPVLPKLTVNLSAVPSTYQDLDTFNSQLSPYQRSQPLTNASIAKLADAAWSEAASKPGYQGIPYTNLAPVTDADVQEYLTNHVRPTIGDLLRPALVPDADAVPIGEFGTGTGNSTGGLIKDVNVVNVPEVKIINKVKLDFGDAPNTPQPNNWATESFETVFQPFINSMFNDTDPLATIPHDVGECPRPTIEIFGKNVVLDAHCALILQHFWTIAVLLKVAYAFLAVTIVLSA